MSGGPPPGDGDLGARGWRVARAPGRVNLIGDHTDYAGGLALPLAIDRTTVVEGDAGGDRVVLTSTEAGGTVDLALDDVDLAHLPGDLPRWGRYVAAVVSLLGPEVGFRGRVRSDVPLGAGLSSSAALELAVALALGFRGSPRELARLGQAAEHLGTGVPCGMLDQLAVAEAVAGHALRIDFTSLATEPVPMPAGADVVVVDSGQRRELGATSYGARRREVEAATSALGGAEGLRRATSADVAAMADPVLRRRARHVVSENARVDEVVAAFRSGDPAAAGRAMVASHASLRDDFEVSTPVVDALVARLVATPGVHGARITGGGFGGCVVALAEPGALTEGWVVQAAAGARLEVGDGNGRDGGPGAGAAGPVPGGDRAAP